MNRISQHLRSNVVGYTALFVAMGGTAAALPGSNTVNSGDIINGQVKAVDVRDDTLNGGGLAATDLQAGSVATSEVLDDSAPGGGLTSDDLRPDSVGSSEIAAESVNGSEIAPSAVETADVANDNLTGADISNAGAGSLTGVDIDESSLGKVPQADTLDGWDSNSFVNTFDFYSRSSNPTGTVNEIIVGCDTGDYALAGGFDNAGNEVDASEPQSSSSWRVYTAWPTESMTAYAMCVNTN